MSKKHKHRIHHHYDVSRRHTPGTTPGTLHIDPLAPKSKVTAVAYNKETTLQLSTVDSNSIKKSMSDFDVTWVNVSGLGDESVILQMSELFDIHKLALEDVVHTHQRAKAEQFDNMLYLVIRFANLNEDTMHLETEQVSLFFGKGFVLTFQESHVDRFATIHDRLMVGKGRIRVGGSDYLAYALLDAIIDHYFPVLEKLGELLEEIEDETLSVANEGTIARINEIRRSLVTLRRAVWPLRELINVLMRDHGGFVSDETAIYLRDCYDHTVGVIDLIESYREVASGLIDMYLSSVSNKMNEIMKVLTMIATVFIPLSFIVGLYGMNFDGEASPLNMPELRFYFGYPVLLLFMATVVLGMLGYFRKRGWIGSSSFKRSNLRDSSSKDPNT